ncbi:ATPase, AAA-type, core [Dillenia turbinata]|uniref:ATPase, AAA-type, core n=1 Tax=Dillenia turbinata TaxID=194707 RepID=A0AAN8V508_9MAGN
MAGKLLQSSAREKKREEEPKVCWRKEVDVKIKRLQSLLFGADLALERKDFATAQVLSLSLLGFLDSHCRTDVDETFIRPIRREAESKLQLARRSLIPDSDRKFEITGDELDLSFYNYKELNLVLRREVFGLLKKEPCPVFAKKGGIDFEKIKQSKYFKSLLQQPKGKASDQLGDKLDRQESKPAKALVQGKLTSMYHNNFSKANNGFCKSHLNSKGNGSEDCTLIESTRSFHASSLGQCISPKVEEEERTHGLTFGKRAHMEISSPRSEKFRSPTSNDEANNDSSGNGFVTARTKLEIDVRQKRGLAASPSSSVSPQSGYSAKSYGYSRRGLRGNFVPPIRSNGGNMGNVTSRIGGKGDDALEDSTKRCLEMLCGPDGELPDKLRNLEPRLVEHVSNEIMDRDPNVRWDDIAGLEHAKKCVTEMVIWPLLRPDIFKGCRSPGRGLLLFGPPGTGKTMIGKAIAGEAKATFFYISASSLTSKWIGEGEKLVRALFGVASCRQPAVIFVDEIDSLLSQRKSDGEHESSRRLKTQFLIEMEGFDSGSEQILLIGATNRPQELDEAARRRLTKRLYIPLPSSEARAWIIQNLLEKDGLFKLSKEDINAICTLTEGYSGSDMKNLVKDASMGPLREALRQGIEITKLQKEDMRPVTLQDFETALQEVRPSVSLNELGTYEEWNRQFGSLSI